MITTLLRARTSSIVLICAYLTAIVAANLALASQIFGPATLYINSFLFIGFDLICRDLLHDRWSGRTGLGGYRMVALILAGGVITSLLNQQASKIALASVLAFVCTGTADTLVYAIGCAIGQARFNRITISNIFGAILDSLIFPFVAYHTVDPQVTTAMIIAKVSGGIFWCVVMLPYVRHYR